MSSRPSRQSSQSRASTRSDVPSNPDVFSDDYALHHTESSDQSPFQDELDTSPSSATHPGDSAPASIRAVSLDSTACSSSHGNDFTTSRSNSSTQSPSTDITLVSRRNLVSASRPQNGDRVSTTSSAFSLARAESPYVGPTTSSHPYGMYPQATRASSIMSASTARPSERSFPATGGPGQPYAMYSQSTVPEEGDAHLPRTNIPLGFPSTRGTGYRENSPRRTADIADIVGSDGHIEQLPPYTPYAGNDSAAKENSTRIRTLSAPAQASPAGLTGLQSGEPPGVANSFEMNSTDHQEQSNDESNASGSFKEKIKRTTHRTVCCGLPLWFLLAIVAVLALGVIIGAVIGVVVVDDSEESAAQQPSSGAHTPTMYVTSFMPAKPLTPNTDDLQFYHCHEHSNPWRRNTSPSRSKC